MSISEGGTLPDATLVRMGTDGPEQVALSSLTAGRKVAIFGVPGAFTGSAPAPMYPASSALATDLPSRGSNR